MKHKFLSSPSNLGSLLHICRRRVKQSLPFCHSEHETKHSWMQLTTSLFLHSTYTHIPYIPSCRPRQKNGYNSFKPLLDFFFLAAEDSIHNQLCLSFWMFSWYKPIAMRHYNLTAIIVIQRILQVHFQNYDSIMTPVHFKCS